ncbi:Hypothetical protein FKW44_018945 [Caligus rogercresseyi]|uniref:Uncharacterized protein n=1 Tax=Caligus rogercresseyi TaxID=217165 RepID=A0A7T8JY38_CALRO|nr:Hypothetical protein FKW44_018945 [Caligus rogercresseyi]
MNVPKWIPNSSTLGRLRSRKDRCNEARRGLCGRDLSRGIRVRRRIRHREWILIGRALRILIAA